MNAEVNAKNNRLITIPMSHYCEKARWALEMANVPYFEDCHLQGFHYLYSIGSAGSATVPVLVTGKDKIKDSTEILKWVDSHMPEPIRLYPKDTAARREVEELEEYLDEVFGPSGRLWMYTYMLNDVGVLFRYSKAHGIPSYEIRMMAAFFPLFKPFANHRLKMAADSRKKSKETVDGVLDKVAALLGSKKYLYCDQFTAADLTFAALSAPVILPDKYGVPLPQLNELSPEMAEQIQIWRSHPSGKFAARLYNESRPNKVNA
jgi:glutathione S-transferase